MLIPYDVKLYHVFVLLSGIAFLEGCASFQSGLVLDPVGPAPNASRVPGSNGVLMVFSAFDPHGHFNGSLYRRYHTDYKIFSQDGALLQVIHNDIAGVMDDPKPVELQAGRYRIVARANGYGWVTVPVLITAHCVTTIHLEGGASWSKDRVLAGDSVRLPDGRIAGWRANQ